MKGWMGPWVLPVGLLVTVALVSLFPSLSAALLPLVWGWVVFPVGLIYLRSRGRGRARGALDDIDIDYWRTKLL
jgi:hypothetical protein